MNIDETVEAFAEGIKYTTEQFWVVPNDIDNGELRSLYRKVCEAYEKYMNLVYEFDDLLYEKEKANK